jgi:hypothetical protein
MYYTRAVASRRIQCVRACVVAMALLGTVPLTARQLPVELAGSAGPSDRSARFITTTERLERGSAAPIELTVVSKAGTAHRAAALIDITKRATALLDQWLGPYPYSRLMIVDAPWNSELLDVMQPGVVIVHARWLNTSRDGALEREVIAGLVRQYWLEAGVGSIRVHEAAYTSGRAIDTLLEISHFHTDRFFGGFLPYSLRSVELSPAPRNLRPRLRRYDESKRGIWMRDDQGQHTARVLETAERALGWPAIQQALQDVRTRPNASLEDFAAAVSERRGYDVSGLFDMARRAARFDYAISGVENRASGNQYDVRITIERLGDGIFPLPLQLETRFADGTTLREPWDARQERSQVEYVSASPAVSVALDPDIVLLLDESRSNNTVRLEPQPLNRLGLRLACSWAIWLQNVMLAYSSIV